VQHQVEQLKATKCQRSLAKYQFPDIAMDMMAKLVSEHNLNLVICVAIQHRIAQHNAPRIAQTHQSSIRGRRFTAQMHGEDSAYTRMSALHQRQQSLCQLAFRQRGKLVEKG